MTTLSQPLASSSSLITKALISATHAVSSLKDGWLAGESVGSDLTYEASRASIASGPPSPFCATAPYDSHGRGTLDNSTLFGDGVLYAGSFLHTPSASAIDSSSSTSRRTSSRCTLPIRAAVQPALLAFIHRVSMMKKAHDQYAAMLEARDAPTV